MTSACSTRSITTRRSITDPPGFISQDPTSGGNNFPLSDRNTDLIDNDDPNGNPRILDIDQINFGALIDFSDSDHDTVSLDGAFTISIRDDVPKLVHGETICLTVDEDDISTLGSNPNPGSLGTSPDDGNGDGSFHRRPDDGNSAARPPCPARWAATLLSWALTSR